MDSNDENVEIHKEPIGGFSFNRNDTDEYGTNYSGYGKISELFKSAMKGYFIYYFEVDEYIMRAD